MIAKSKAATTSLLLGAIGVAVVGGIFAARKRSRSEGRAELNPSTPTAKQGRLERFFERLPADSPPKLMMSILPRLREQNDEIIALLRQQNEWMRQERAESVTGK